ncbi:MAG TPA: hypothetical protein VGR47_05850 [Terracidiphilus sp.]|nr:hypothetical protein [Terracidiphilus sp.]
MSRKPPNWEKTGTIVGYAEWLRSASGAFAVLVLRRDDAAMAVDEDLAPRDARELLLERMEPLIADLAAARREGRKAARVELEPVRE